MTIIISILKWLLMILLALLVLVLVLVACFLFVPARYYVYGKQDGSWSMKGHASWLFHILHFSFEVQKGEMQKKLRIFGFPVSLEGKKSKKKKRKKKKSEQKHEKKPDVEAGKVKTENTSVEYPKKHLEPEKESEEGQEMEKETKRSLPEKSEEVLKKKAKPSAKAEGEFAKKRKNKKRLSIKDVIAKIKKGLTMVARVLTEGPRALIEGTKAEKLVTILQDSNTLELWHLIWANLGRLWRHSRPKKIKGRIHFGTSDPCTTGQILGVIGAGCGLLGTGVKIEPDFENKVLEGYLEVKGRIQVYMLLWILKDVFWSEEWKYFKKQKDM